MHSVFHMKQEPSDGDRSQSVVQVYIQFRDMTSMLPSLPQRFVKIHGGFCQTLHNDHNSPEASLVRDLRSNTLKEPSDFPAAIEKDEDSEFIVVLHHVHQRH